MEASSREENEGDDNPSIDYREINPTECNESTRLAFVTLFAQAFPDDEEEIAKYVMRREKTAHYDYSTVFVPSVFNDGKVVSAAVVVKKQIRSYNVWELIWFVTDKCVRCRNLGTTLFDRLYGSARREGVDAILVCSTNSALSFWLTQKEKPIFRTVYGGTTPNFEHTKWPLRKLFASRGEEDALFTFERYPNCTPDESIITLYTDTIWRDRKGRISKSTVFQGSPYRYDIQQSNHLWFPIAKSLVKKLKTSSRVRKRRGRKKTTKRKTKSDSSRPNVAHASTHSSRHASGVVIHSRRKRFWSFECQEETDLFEETKGSPFDETNAHPSELACPCP